MRMRLTEVRKRLASAHTANVAFMNTEGGMLFPKDSVPGRKLEEYSKKPSTGLSATSTEAGSAALPLPGAAGKLSFKAATYPLPANKET
eukprot:834528-Amphidinium_carterae.2